MFHNKIDKGIYWFLKSFYKCNDFSKSINIIKSKINCDDLYASFIASECVKYNYLEGVIVSASMNNYKNIVNAEHSRVNRQGLQFIDKYNSDILNFFWIPFKNIILIVITALITLLIQKCF